MKQIRNKIVETVCLLLKSCNINISVRHIQKLLTAHPDYPSLLSITESLLEWGIKTEALQGTIHDLSADDFPGIVHLKNNEYMVAESLQGEIIQLISPGEMRQSLTLENFANIWTGIILRVLPTTDAPENRNPMPKHERILGVAQRFLSWPSLFMFFLGCFFYLLFSFPDIHLLLPIGIIKTLGMIICAILFLSHSGGAYLLEKICPGGEISDCHRVVHSPAGKIWGIPMAELGLLYFSGGFLVLFFSMLADSVGFSLFTLGVLSFLALPYTLFSIFYQARVVHSWCWLCLTIQVLFWCEAIILFRAVFRGFQVPPSVALFPVVLGFGLVILIWLPTRQIIKEYPALKEKEREISRLRAQPDYLHYLFSKTKPIDITPFPIEIGIGPNQAPITLTMVVNPLCLHCGSSFEELRLMVHFHPGTVRGVIRFLLGGRDGEKSESEKRHDYQIALQMTTLAAAGKQSDMEEALAVWFAGKEDLSRRFLLNWRKKYTIDNPTAREQAIDILLLHEQWTQKNNFHSTPLLYMNGLKLPKGIGFKDLKYFFRRLPI